MSEAGVEFAKVSYAPPSQRLILKDVSLALAPGTVTALLGRSGSGKTTLMRMVNGLAMPTAGSVRVAGQETRNWNPLELRRNIGYVIQETGLFPHWTVERNAGLALEFAGASPAERKSRVEEVLQLAGLEPGLKDRYPWQLSGGQRQRVGVARAIAGKPAILLMDEPFGALDPMTRAEMQDMLLGLLATVKTTVLLVTHDLNEALYLASRVVFLEEGEVVADLAAEDVSKSEDERVKRYVAAVRRS
jgi:osmoprotectant transport system ATP-binding protein